MHEWYGWYAVSPNASQGQGHEPLKVRISSPLKMSPPRD